MSFQRKDAEAQRISGSWSVFSLRLGVFALNAHMSFHTHMNFEREGAQAQSARRKQERFISEVSFALFSGREMLLVFRGLGEVHDLL